MPISATLAEFAIAAAGCGGAFALGVAWANTQHRRRSAEEARHRRSVLAESDRQRAARASEATPQSRSSQAKMRMGR